MAKRRTIGDNPLDSLEQKTSAKAESADQSQSKGDDADSHVVQATETEAASPPVTAAAASVAVATVLTDKGNADPAQNGQGQSWKTWWDQALHNDIWIIAGDLPLGRARLTGLGLGKQRLIRLLDGTGIALPGDVARLTKLANHADRKISAMLLWGAAGAFIAGPIGAMAGGLFGGRERSKAVFELEMKDGRRMRAETHPATLKAIEAELA